MYELAILFYWKELEELMNNLLAEFLIKKVLPERVEEQLRNYFESLLIAEGADCFIVWTKKAEHFSEVDKFVRWVWNHFKEIYSQIWEEKSK